MEYNSALKRTDLSKLWRDGRNLNDITKFKKSQSEKTTYWMIPTIWHSAKSKIMDSVKKIRDCQRLQRREGWTGRVERIFWAMEKNHSVYSNAGYILYICQKP